MKRLLIVCGLLAPALLVGQLAASAAAASAHIVSCSTATACYSPNPIRITLGSTVTWTNDHSLAHTATSDSGAWDTGAIAAGATSSAITFNAAGTFAYHCRFHSDMHGTVIVSAASTAQPAPTVRSTTAARPRTLAQSGSGIPALPIGAGLALAGLVLLAGGILRRRRLQS